MGSVLLVLATLALFFLVRSLGQNLSAPSPQGASAFAAGPPQEQIDALLHVLLALAVIIVVARAVGALFNRLHQPPVMGEILAGILLGPSLLGRIAPGVSAFLLPPLVAPFLEVLSQVGVILYMFLVGLELDPNLLRRHGRSTLVVSVGSIVTPFAVGSLLALLLYPRLGTNDVPFSVFSLFLAVSMSVTAFPVLARILTDRRIHKSQLGVMALTAAAVNDAVGWCLLAVVVSVVHARVAGGLLTTLMAAGYAAVMVFAVRPAMVRLTLLYGNRGRLTQDVLSIVSVALLLSALGTHLIGIHAVFGAFLIGAVIPHDSGLARELMDKLEDVVVVLLLPAFFAFTGLRTQIGLVSTAEQWLLCGLIILLATAAKVGGTVLAARMSHLPWIEGLGLGVLMNTRGLMELIVLNIGLDLGVISPTLFAMLVLMALVTTLMTTPLLELIRRVRGRREESEMPPRAPSPPTEERRGVMVPIANPEGIPVLLHLAKVATAPEEPAPRVLALVRRPSGGVRSGLREVERRVPPRAPILAAAMSHARASGLRIDLEAVWTDDPAADILRAAQEGNSRWLLLGHHRPVFGGDLLGGVVKQVLDQPLPLHVGVIIHGHQRNLERIVAVVDESADGIASLELAARIVQHTQGSLHAVLVPKPGSQPDPGLTAQLKEAGRTTGRWIHTDVLVQRTPAHLAQVTRGDLVVIGIQLADELGLPLDDDPGDERCVVVVRGAVGTRRLSEDTNPIPDNAASAHV